MAGLRQLIREYRLEAEYESALTIQREIELHINRPDIGDGTKVILAICSRGLTREADRIADLMDPEYTEAE